MGYSVCSDVYRDLHINSNFDAGEKIKVIENIIMNIEWKRKGEWLWDSGFLC